MEFQRSRVPFSLTSADARPGKFSLAGRTRRKASNCNISCLQVELIASMLLLVCARMLLSPGKFALAHRLPMQVCRGWEQACAPTIRAYSP